jgi:hypothetical protein
LVTQPKTVSRLPDAKEKQYWLSAAWREPCLPEAVRHERTMSSAKIRPNFQVIPEGAGPVKTYFGRVFVRSATFLVLVGRIEAGVGVKARAEPDRVAAVGP